MSQAEERNFLIFILIFVAMMAIFFFIADYKSNLAYKKIEEAKIALRNELDLLTLEAKAVSVFDVSVNEKIYSRNDDLILPSASLLKTLTVLVALEGHKEDDIISISQNAVDENGDSGFFINEKWRIGDLAKLTLIGSLNDGAYALSQNTSDFFYKIKEKAKSIGIGSTRFSNSTGLDLNEKESGSYLSALDANILAIYAFRTHPEIFGSTTLPEITLKSESGFSHSVKNTNLIIDKIPNLLFSKTGNTVLAGGNLTIIFLNKDGHEIAVTVLGSSKDGRFSDMEKLLNVLYNISYASGN